MALQPRPERQPVGLETERRRRGGHEILQATDTKLSSTEANGGFPGAVGAIAPALPSPIRRSTARSVCFRAGSGPASPETSRTARRRASSTRSSPSAANRSSNWAGSSSMASRHSSTNPSAIAVDAWPGMVAAARRARKEGRPDEGGNRGERRIEEVSVIGGKIMKAPATGDKRAARRSFGVPPPITAPSRGAVPAEQASRHTSTRRPLPDRADDRPSDGASPWDHMHCTPGRSSKATAARWRPRSPRAPSSTRPPSRRGWPAASRRPRRPRPRTSCSSARMICSFFMVDLLCDGQVPRGSSATRPDQHPIVSAAPARTKSPYHQQTDRRKPDSYRSIIFTRERRLAPLCCRCSPAEPWSPRHRRLHRGTEMHMKQQKPRKQTARERVSEGSAGLVDAGFHARRCAISCRGIIRGGASRCGVAPHRLHYRSWSHPSIDWTSEGVRFAGRTWGAPVGSKRPNARDAEREVRGLAPGWLLGRCHLGGASPERSSTRTTISTIWIRRAKRRSPRSTPACRRDAAEIEETVASLRAQELRRNPIVRVGEERREITALDVDEFRAVI